jgi:putative tryptophan/tyrosine transport system substrate-binding protein
VKTDKLLADAASYIDRILRDANPAELPVQAPTEYEFAVNQKAARQLGLRLPPALLARADEGQSGTAVSAPYRFAISAGSGST